MPDFTRHQIGLPGQDGEVAWLDFGDPARPVDAIFAHANGFNALTYRQALAPLGEQLRIIAPDLRGHGRTTLAADADARVDWMDLSRDLLDLMDALGIDYPVTLAGHSMGGRACLMAADLAPERVKRLALLEPVMFRRREQVEVSSTGNVLAEGAMRRRSRFDSREVAVESWRGRGAFRTWPDAVLEDYATDGLVEDGDGVRVACTPAWEASGYLTSGNGPYAFPVLYGIGIPTLVLKGSVGSTCEASASDPEAAANPCLEIREVEGATHFLPMERGDVVAEALGSARSR